MSARSDRAREWEFGHFKETAVTLLSPCFRAWKWNQRSLKLVSRGDCTDGRVRPSEGPGLACLAVGDGAGRLCGKGSAFPSFCYLFGVIPTERNGSSSSPLPTLDCALHSSLPSFHSFCRHMLVHGDGRERAGSAGSSSTLPSPEVPRCAHPGTEGWGPARLPGVRVQLAWPGWCDVSPSPSYCPSCSPLPSSAGACGCLCCLQGAHQLQEHNKV